MNTGLRSENGTGALPLVLVLIVVLSGAMFLYWSWHSGAERNAAPEPGAPSLGEPQGSSDAPPFSLKDVNGNTYASARFAGKPTVINFFTTWCPSCKDEIPGFVEVYDRHKGMGFEMIGISLDTDTRGALPDFLSRYRIQYTVLLGNVETVRAYGGFSTVPTTFFVGKDGKIKNVIAGHIGTEVFDREVRKLF